MKEKCVLCEKETAVDISTPVDFREHYVDGAGQLCPECWHVVYDERRFKS